MQTGEVLQRRMQKETSAQIKKQCEEHVRLAAEQTAKLHDEMIFKQPLPLEDCQICFIRLPFLLSGRTYMSCCGKSICRGCIHAPVYDDQGNKVDEKTCPFCRTPPPHTMEEAVERMTKRVKADDPIAIFNYGGYYVEGVHGFKQDHAKALEYWHRAAELGYANGYCNIGIAYMLGKGVEVNRKKGMYYYELAAIKGNEVARYKLGYWDEKLGNIDRALKHHMIAAGGGFAESLENIQDMYSAGLATKDNYTKALQSYQEYLSEIKSSQRDKAAAFDSEKYRYYK